MKACLYVQSVVIILSTILLPGCEVPEMKHGDFEPCTMKGDSDCAFTLVVDGRNREYLFHIPDGYDGSAIPLVIDVHGYTSTFEV
ncbi:MAG: hypothetical protein JXR76_00205 [Deltaproteobacteria bacterium]|nr:hypothetical protein [Deltaproteobacteria bacterium]